MALNNQQMYWASCKKIYLDDENHMIKWESAPMKIGQLQSAFFCTVSSNTYAQCPENVKNSLMTDTF